MFLSILEVDTMVQHDMNAYKVFSSNRHVKSIIVAIAKVNAIDVGAMIQHPESQTPSKVRILMRLHGLHQQSSSIDTDFIDICTLEDTMNCLEVITLPQS